MSAPSGLRIDLNEEVELLSSGPLAEPQTAGSKAPVDSDDVEDRKTFGEEVKEEEEEEEEEEAEEVEEKPGSALLEPSTLPWPGDRDRRPQTDLDDGIWSEPEERDTGISGGSQDLSEGRSQVLSEGRSQTESDKKSKDKWRESMPEGERWRDDEIEVQHNDKGDGSLADDEEEEEEEDQHANWISEKAALGFTPQVTIVRPSSKEPPEESRLYVDKDVDKEALGGLDPQHFYHDWGEEEDKYSFCAHVCSEKAKLALATVSGGLLFPLLVWGGYALLPFDSPLLETTPVRVLYTLRCAFFATIPIMLGVVVQGVARLRYGVIKPLFQTDTVLREVAVHAHFVNESLALFLFYFLQLAVMATYVRQDLVKLVPLLTIIFVFGRLIYWICLSLGSSVRGFGFGFSFFPILVMLCANLYFICSSVGESSVFDVEPPTTAPPPRQRWWW